MSGFVEKKDLEKILMNLDNRFNSIKGIAEGMGKIFWLSSPITLSLTWDDAWHTHDFTAQTSENAKGVFLGVYLARGSGSNYEGYFYTAKYNNTAFEGIVQNYFDSTNGFKIGGSWSQGIDDEQRMNYKGSQASTARTVKLLGYWE